MTVTDRENGNNAVADERRTTAELSAIVMRRCVEIYRRVRQGTIGGESTLEALQRIIEEKNSVALSYRPKEVSRISLKRKFKGGDGPQTRLIDTLGQAVDLICCFDGLAYNGWATVVDAGFAGFVELSVGTQYSRFGGHMWILPTTLETTAKLIIRILAPYCYRAPHVSICSFKEQGEERYHVQIHARIRREFAHELYRAVDNVADGTPMKAEAVWYGTN